MYTTTPSIQIYLSGNFICSAERRLCRKNHQIQILKPWILNSNPDEKTLESLSATTDLGIEKHIPRRNGEDNNRKTTKTQITQIIKKLRVSYTCV